MLLTAQETSYFLLTLREIGAAELFLFLWWIPSSTTCKRIKVQCFRFFLDRIPPAFVLSDENHSSLLGFQYATIAFAFTTRNNSDLIFVLQNGEGTTR